MQQTTTIWYTETEFESECPLLQEIELDWQEDEVTQIEFNDIHRYCILGNEVFFHPGPQK